MREARRRKMDDDGNGKVLLAFGNWDLRVVHGWTAYGDVYSYYEPSLKSGAISWSLQVCS